MRIGGEKCMREVPYSDFLGTPSSDPENSVSWVRLYSNCKRPALHINQYSAKVQISFLCLSELKLPSGLLGLTIQSISFFSTWCSNLARLIDLTDATFRQSLSLSHWTPVDNDPYHRGTNRSGSARFTTDADLITQEQSSVWFRCKLVSYR
jgi:hypothetical protein